MYLYEMLAKSEENPTERQLMEFAAELGAIRLQHDDVPQILVIKEAPNGCIKNLIPIRGYCSHDGKYICIRHGLAPRDLVGTVIHEMKHIHQALDPK